MITLHLSIASRWRPLPSRRKILSWLEAAFHDRPEASAIGVRIVAPQEMQSLNAHYRNKDRPTNILSFSYDAETSPDNEPPLIGDLVICPDVLAQEAAEQELDPQAHWAHIVIHGALHLQGLDHETPKERRRMERREIRILKTLGFADPYGNPGCPLSGL